MTSPPEKLTRLAEPLVGPEAQWSLLAGDGSDRIFWRVGEPGQSLVAVDGSALSPERWAENTALAAISKHLRAAGLPVPEMLAQLPQEGLFLIQDLGSVHLADAALAADETGKMRLYRQAVDLLIDLQFRASPGFDTAWCSQTGKYDSAMVRRFEIDYFFNAFVSGFLNLENPAQDLAGELEGLARAAAGAGEPVFLHRDFQSRNIMVFEDGLKIIDFQSARLGPPGYDLASLIIDPYVGLEKGLRADIRAHYLDRAASAGLVEAGTFESNYQLLALHRNFQMLGAFGHLALVKGRAKFLDYIPAALAGLKDRLAGPDFDRWPGVQRLVLGLPEPGKRIDEVRYGR